MFIDAAAYAAAAAEHLRTASRHAHTTHACQSAFTPLDNADGRQTRQAFMALRRRSTGGSVPRRFRQNLPAYCYLAHTRLAPPVLLFVTPHLSTFIAASHYATFYHIPTCTACSH